MSESKAKKYTLSELIEKSNEDIVLLVGVLADNHLLSDYQIEYENIKQSIQVKERYTIAEFKKLIENYKKKEV